MNPQWDNYVEEWDELLEQVDLRRHNTVNHLYFKYELYSDETGRVN